MITNRKPIENLKYILEADPDFLKDAKDKMRNKEDCAPEDRIEADYLPTELDEEIDQIEFKESRSSGSCYIDDIQCIIYGPLSSRFWMLRKHINTKTPA